MNARTISCRRGFTLVELLVVVGIIAVLISILLPVISRSRKNARTVACLSNLRQIGIALREYAVENRDSLPLGYVRLNDNEDAYWINYVNNYLTQRGTSREDTQVVTKTFICPEGTFPNKENYYTAHPVMFPDWDFDAAHTIKPARFSRLRPDNIMIMDGVQFPAQDYVVSFLCYNLDDGTIFPGYYYIGTQYEAQAQNQWYYDPNSPSEKDPRFGSGFPIEPGANEDTDANVAEIRWRHRDSTGKSKRGCANFLFADGRVETLAQKDVMRKMILLSR